jgi:PAS domain S-box-containing protein
MDLSEYALEALRMDGGLVLSRGRQRSPSASGAGSILLLSTLSAHPTGATLKRLEHEYELARELRSASPDRQIAITEHEGRTTLLLDDPGGEPLDRLLGAPMEVGVSLRLAAGLASALRELHALGIIHKDLKPANALADLATGRMSLVGFGIASRLRRERQPIEPPEMIAGSLPYMAPEQTGRMNRSIDSRSDLHAAGVMLYEMLTATLPFNASHPMEWVHCHVARRPVPPAERREGIPGPVSAIILKLLAKTPEDRYQTAAGLERDLRRCLASWELHGRVDDFLLGQDDAPDRLLVPEKLYGRSREIETLLAAFDRVMAGGKPALLLVSGHSGIGKSSVVNELHKALVPPRGFLASGKFDQFKRDIPYDTLAQALQTLIQPLLAKSEAELSPWRDALRLALESNGRLMLSLVPQLELIVGEQPEVSELSPQEAQLRFQVVFRRLLGVFARPEHPLVLLLDDLQWLDDATLDLVEDLMTRSQLPHLMLIGAYRDDEVTPAHPLMRRLDVIRNAGALVPEVKLSALAREDVGELVADALRCSSTDAAPLAALVHEKTFGNPFFIIQFLSALADEGLLAYDHAAGRWSWDLGRIHAKGYTANVADLMIRKLLRLPAATQEALRQLACFGSNANPAMLALVSETPEEQVHANLWEAVRLELVEPLDGAYRFTHDRVREAVYSQIAESLRAEAHLRIGRLLAERTPVKSRRDAIFEIVNQLNRGVAAMASRGEREHLAELNLAAGKRARASSAHVSALSYLANGTALLQEDAWGRRRELAFALELNRAECEFLTGAVAHAFERLAALSSRVATTLEHAAVSSLRMDVCTTLGQGERAIAAGLDYLRQLGIDWPAHPAEEEARRAYDRIWAALRSRRTEELMELPLMSDPVARATVDVLTRLIPSAMIADANLYALVICQAVELSLQHGHTDGSCWAYVMLGQQAALRFGDYQAASRFGQLGHDLVERRGLTRFRTRIYLTFGSVIVPMTRSVRSGREIMRRAFEVAVQDGDVTFACYSSFLVGLNMLVAGDPLEQTQREVENGLLLAQKMQFGFMIDSIATNLALIHNLRGQTPRFGSLDGGSFDELQIERRFAGNPGLALGEFWYWTRKLEARYLAGDYQAAVEASLRAQPLLRTSPSPVEAAQLHFYGALTFAALCESASGDERQRHISSLAAHHRQLTVWAGHGPQTFGDRAALAGAELARVEGRALEAEQLYEMAIRSARQNGFVHNEALANELAARFYDSRGFDTVSRAFLREACHCYLRWGAEGKVRQLEEKHPLLKERGAVSGPASTIETPVDNLDLATVLDVSQALSGEIELEKLVDTLLRTALEHAGAERGLLIVSRDGELSIEAEANTGGDTVTVRLHESLVAGAELPESLVRYTARTLERMILDDASAQNAFPADDYFRRVRARSVLCLPLVKQSRLVALLYLENNLAPRVFTPARTAVLEVLASQAAMALESARLYREIQERESKIRRLVDANVVGVLISNLEGQVLEANDAFLEMVGYAREDLDSGRIKWQELTPPEWEAVSERALAQVRANGSAEPFEKEYVHKDGSRVPVLLATGAVAGARARMETVAFVVDLRERKEAEEALLRAREELARVTRVMTLGELAASIAHEVNQPLAALGMYAGAGLQWLQRDPPNLEKARHALQDIIQEAEHAGEIVSRIRALIKKAPPRAETVDLDEVILEVLGLRESELQRNGISVRTQLAIDRRIVHGDRIQLQQLVLNLIVNAADAMSDPGSAPRELSLSSRNEGANAILVEVRDSGRGFQAATAERIFEPFFTTKPDGMGMGLSISRSIVVGHGGRLWAAPNEPRGAVFRFALPAVESETHPKE